MNLHTESVCNTLEKKSTNWVRSESTSRVDLYTLRVI